MEVKQQEWVIEEIKGEIKYLKTKENGMTMIQNLWITSKAVLKGKFTVLWAYLRKQEKKSQIKNLNLHLKELENRKNKTAC